ncbi:hypothetical protein DFJ74DRAFT_710769 [Hyaloraphidium curvatum]|nr:hypothetical protein DFJ74DRAFT_710769 [Hyaloraphidium curvatum]
MEDYSTTLAVHRFGERPMLCERTLRMVSADVKRAVEAGTALLDLPDLRAFKRAAVDARRWRCFACGGSKEVEVFTSVALPNIPGRDGTIRLFLTCHPRCAKSVCIEKTKREVERIRKGMDSLNDTTFNAPEVLEPVTVTLLGVHGRRETHEGFMTPPDEMPLSHTVMAFQQILGSYNVDMSSGRRIGSFVCASCGQIASAYSLAVTKTVPEGPDEVSWNSYVWPYCEDDKCRKIAVAAAEVLAGGRPDAFA